jgi:preprotein translocase subunit SecA
MDYMREGIHLRSFAQKDPLVEYRGEGHAMFEELGVGIREEVVFTLFHAEIEATAAAPLEQSQQNGNLQYAHETSAGADVIAAAGGASVAGAGALGLGGSTSTMSPQTVVVSEKDKIGRNDPCWCGSGKKFKKCHGA